MERQTQAYLYAAGAVLAWATAASAFKLSLQSLTPLELLLLASLTSTTLLGLMLLLQRRLGELRRWPRADWWHSLGLGALNPFLYYLVLLQAYARLPAQEAQPLNYAWPLVLTVLSSLILRQPLSLRVLGAMLVSLCGIAVISTRGEPWALRFSDPLGVGLALGSTLIWASYWLLTARDTVEPVLRLFANFLCGSLLVLVWWWLTATPRVLPLAGVLGAVYVGVFEMGLTFVLWLTALRRSRTAAQVSGLVYFSPFLSLLCIALVLGERIRASTLCGLLLIVGGIVLQQYADRRSRRAGVATSGAAS